MPPPPTRRRADARRNAERLLSAADAAFAADGAGAPLERIARDAGLAIGTLYGHFPSRRALVAALLRERHDALFAGAERLSEDPDASATLAGWAHAAVEHCATYRGLAEMLASGRADEQSELHEDCRRMAAITDRLTTRAREAGAIAASVRADDVTTLVDAAAWVRERGDAAAARRLVAHGLAGLAPHAAPPPPPDDEGAPAGR